jgi:23S rRNA (uracil1939-C5)-methyltransferase
LPVVTIHWKGELAASAFGTAERRVRERAMAGVELWTEGARTPATIGDPGIVVPMREGPPLRVPAGAFAQASEVGDAVLIDRVLARAEAEGRRVLELFAGSGNFTVALAAVAAHVTTVELSAPACDAARRNLAARGLGAKTKIVTGDADHPEIPARTDVVVLDPPRSGARGACAAIAAKRPSRVVYVSCDPATLGRDLATLLDVGYAVQSIDAVDLFPGTSHVETVVALART